MVEYLVEIETLSVCVYLWQPAAKGQLLQQRLDCVGTQAYMHQLHLQDQL